MIRVAYRFRVDPARLDEFRVAWHNVTEAMRASYAGARGSTLLVDDDDPTSVLLFALWTSREDWQRSRERDEPLTPDEAVMLDIGRPESITVYELVEDLAEPTPA